MKQVIDTAAAPGFRPWRQKELAAPVLEALPADPVETAKLVADMSDSADFDWPGGDRDEFADWLHFYLNFRNIAREPRAYSAAALQKVLDGFLALEAPDPEFSPTFGRYRHGGLRFHVPVFSEYHHELRRRPDAVVSGRRAWPRSATAFDPDPP